MNGAVVQVSRSNGGIPKYAVEGPVMLTSEGLEGDFHRDLRHHGGPDKAVLMISAEVLESLKHDGFPVFHGGLGENLTVRGLDVTRWRAGQRYRVGEDAVIELTKLRTPCSNLDVYGEAIKPRLYDRQCRAGDPDTPVWARGGFYARVIKPGLVIAGAPVELTSEAA
jgi:MOSC domain-containing protein YiiM